MAIMAGREDNVRMVHMLTSEMSIIQQLPALPSCVFASSCLCLLTKHITCVHAPLSPSPLHPSTQMLLPRCLSSHHLQSICRLPWSPLHSPLKFCCRTQSAPSKPFSVAQDPCRLKLQMLTALNNCQVCISYIDTSPHEVPLGLK